VFIAVTLAIESAIDRNTGLLVWKSLAANGSCVCIILGYKAVGSGATVRFKLLTSQRLSAHQASNSNQGKTTTSNSSATALIVKLMYLRNDARSRMQVKSIFSHSHTQTTGTGIHWCLSCMLQAFTSTLFDVWKGRENVR
jgi:hypothetical protein